tara:strand:- start:4343 stop:5200 length:858 start_codon:yes stop_codon:yes gene_type:complete
MSTQITTAFVNQFSANVTMLSQQQGSLLRDTVDSESVNGEKAFFDQIGSAAAALRTTRHGDTPLMETPHDRRMVTLNDYEYADLIDDQDRIRMLASPESSYAKAAANALGRAMDDAIITAFNASAKTGKSGSTSTALPAGNVIAHGSAGLTVAKLITAKKLLDAGSVDPSINRYIVVSPEQIEDLLNTTSVTSADFNTVKALATGTVDSFVGFKFIVSNRLKDDGTSRQCYAWAEDGMKLAIGKDIKAEITQRPDKSYATQVYYCASFGATRMEEAKVIQVLCNE